AGNRQDDDRELYGGSLQRSPAKDAGCLPGLESAIQEGAAFGYRDVDESEPFVRPGASRHDRDGRGDPAGRAASQRKPRSALQARISRARRREIPQDHFGELPRGERLAADRVWPGGHEPGGAASADVWEG